jgi:hypothetical protein
MSRPSLPTPRIAWGDEHPPQPVSTGAGIALAGVWLACAALSAVFLLIAFVWSPEPSYQVTREEESQAALFAVILAALPMVAAFFTTLLILNKDDHG